MGEKVGSKDGEKHLEGNSEPRASVIYFPSSHQHVHVNATGFLPLLGMQPQPVHDFVKTESVSVSLLVFALGSRWTVGDLVVVLRQVKKMETDDFLFLAGFWSRDVGTGSRKRASSG